MTLPVPVVWSEDCLRHDPGGEVWLGVREAGTEVAQRAVVLRDALTAGGAPLVAAASHDDSALAAVHDRDLLDHLASVWEEWQRAGFPAEHGRDRVVPYVFPTPGFLAGLPAGRPPAVHGRAGRYCYDTMTLVGPGSWAAIRGAADAALTAAGLVNSGEKLAYALCRPPGHHATRAAYGGSCYLNNAAIAAQALRGAGAARVAVIDLDAHHGNGTQMIFYDRADVWYGSLHVDPGAGWFPHYAGYSGERGTGAGLGANRNLPLPPGTGDADWLAAVDLLCGEAAAHAAEAIVVSLGLDAAAPDPESPLRVSEDAYRQACRHVAALGPAVLVQEGGYDLASLGGFAVAALTGAAEGASGLSAARPMGPVMLPVEREHGHVACAWGSGRPGGVSPKKPPAMRNPNPVLACQTITRLRREIPRAVSAMPDRGEREWLERAWVGESRIYQRDRQQRRHRVLAEDRADRPGVHTSRQAA
jgi:acetoin utilization deacetylase AcuC-like enzyme